MGNNPLLHLAKERFGNLTYAEAELLKAAFEGRMADTRPDEKGDDNPANVDTSEDWKNPGRVVHAKLLCWLCTDKKALEHVDPKGVWLYAAKIKGELDLQFVVLPHSLILFRCSIKEGIVLLGAEAVAINFRGSHVGSGGIALIADNLKIKGNVFLDENFHAMGEVRLLGADIGGNLECNNGIFKNENGKAFNADRLKTKGTVFLNDGFHAVGEVRFLGADIGGDLSCRGGRFKNKGGNALSADGLKTKGSVFLDKGFHATGEVRLPGADIGINLECRNGTFENNGGFALNANYLKTTGGVFLDQGFRAMGEVRLLGANIGRNLDCRGATFENVGGKALCGDGLKTKGDVFLDRGFRAGGEVRLLGADIGGDLDCSKGTFENAGGKAISADGLKTKGAVFFKEGFHARGEVRLHGADIGGQFSCRNGTFENEGGDAISAQHLRVHQVFFYQPKTVAGAVNLTAASVGTLEDDVDKWPERKTILDGLVYERFAGSAPVKAEGRIAWLRRQPAEDGFRPQPYEQLAKVLRAMGHESEARKVLIAKWDDLLKYNTVTGITWYWNRFLGVTIRYGWEAWRACAVILVMILVGWGFFAFANHQDVMRPSKERVYLDSKVQETLKAEGKWPEDYPKFNAFIYSIDTFIPFMNFHVEDYWLPNANNKGERWYQCGVLYRGYLWFHIAMGWIFSSLAAVSLTGLIRKE